MTQDDVLIKWTGSKRLQAPHILQHFPKEINTYHEPFLGGGSMLFSLLNSDIKVSSYKCSDINETLMKIWEIAKDSPKDLSDFYEKTWPIDKNSYYSLRGEFNKDRDPKKFFVLLRTCRNGLVRYNRKGEFNSGFHLGRKGKNPSKMADTIEKWSAILKQKEVQFFVQSYEDVQSHEGDFMYLDPPYFAPTKEVFYQEEMNFNPFWPWLARQYAYALSLNGQVSQKLYSEHHSIPAGFHRLNRTEKTAVVDDLYIRRDHELSSNR